MRGTSMKPACGTKQCRALSKPMVAHRAPMGMPKVASAQLSSPQIPACLSQAAPSSWKRDVRTAAFNSLLEVERPLPSNGTDASFTINKGATDSVLQRWRTADAVCFDVDCTVTVNDGLDLLAEFMGCKEAVEKLTSQAMDGTVSLKESLEQRLDLINCTPADIKRFIKAHPPRSRLAPNIEELIKTLQARGVAVYLISGGFRELTLPIATYLGVPKENVFANRMVWQWDDETMAPTKLVGLDLNELTAQNLGKPIAIDRIRENNPYNNIVMVGDGITDLEAVQTSGGADLFIGYGGIVERPTVAREAEWFVYDHATLTQALKRFKVACVGSGAWASAALRMVAQNVTIEDDPADEFDDTVTMWVRDPDAADEMNESHLNAKYLPGVPMGDNVHAVSDVVEAVKDADCIILCAPHQFIHGICKKLAGKVKPGAMVISLIKGMRVQPEGPQLISTMVTRLLNVDCSVLMGANIALDVGKEEMSEAVIGYNNLANAKIWQRLFKRPYFSVELVPDIAGAEMCGTLKNIVAVGAGIVDGLGLGANSKAAVIRQGLQEMRVLAKALYPSVRDETFLQSCGVADLIATCYGGRNRLVAEAWTKEQVAGNLKTFEQLEKEMLNGQKLQGTLTSYEVQEILKRRKWETQYPLFTTINRIISGRLPASAITRFVDSAALDLSGHSSSDYDDELDIPKHKPANAPTKPKTAKAPAAAATPTPVAAVVAAATIEERAPEPAKPEIVPSLAIPESLADMAPTGPMPVMEVNRAAM